MSDIIELLERRSEQGIALLKEKYADYCYSIIYRLLQDREQAEEALNDVWLQIWNNIPPARPQCLRAYLAKTARNAALHYIRHNDAQKRNGVMLLLDELAECIPDPKCGRDTNDLKELLRNFVSALSHEERQIFLRRYWYGADIREIAKDRGCTENRIAGILFRTRKKLKKYLEKEGYKL